MKSTGLRIQQLVEECSSEENPIRIDAYGEPTIQKDRTMFEIYKSTAFDSYYVRHVAGRTQEQSSGCVGTFSQAMSWLAARVLYGI